MPDHSYLWRTNWYLLYGRCYTFQVPPDILKLGVEDAIFSFRSNVYVFLHHPGQFTSSDSKTKVSSEMGRKLFLDINYDLMENIPMRRDDFALGGNDLLLQPEQLQFPKICCVFVRARCSTKQEKFRAKCSFFCLQFRRHDVIVHAHVAGVSFAAHAVTLSSPIPHLRPHVGLWLRRLHLQRREGSADGSVRLRPSLRHQPGRRRPRLSHGRLVDGATKANKTVLSQ